MTTSVDKPTAVALVTGGRRGIGRGIVRELAKAGFDVIVNDLVHDEAMDQACQEVSALGRQALALVGDIADLDGQAALVDRAWRAFGGIDCLVNNAGVTVDVVGDMLDVSVASYDRNLAVNTRAPFFLTQRIAKRMLAEPDPAHYRCIVFISAGNVYMASPDRAEYCISKTAVSMMVKLFATRLAAAGIGVHEVRPGITLTEMSKASAEKFARLDAMVRSGSVVPLGRWGAPEDLGRGIAALASGVFSFSTGSAFDIDGGLHIHRF